VKVASAARKRRKRRNCWRSRRGPGSAGYQHYGRLAGFTNRKDEHWTIVPVDIWVSGGSNGTTPAARAPSLTRREAERIAREHEEARSIAFEPG